MFLDEQESTVNSGCSEVPRDQNFISLHPDYHYIDTPDVMIFLDFVSLHPEFIMSRVHCYIFQDFIATSGTMGKSTRN